MYAEYKREWTPEHQTHKAHMVAPPMVNWPVSTCTLHPPLLHMAPHPTPKPNYTPTPFFIPTSNTLLTQLWAPHISTTPPPNLRHAWPSHPIVLYPNMRPYTPSKHAHRSNPSNIANTLILKFARESYSSHLESLSFTHLTFHAHISTHNHIDEEHHNLYSPKACTLYTLATTPCIPHYV